MIDWSIDANSDDAILNFSVWYLCDWWGIYVELELDHWVSNC